MSLERVRLPRGVVSLYTAECAAEPSRAPIQGVAPRGTEPARVGIAASEVKALQAHAFERGRALERTTSTDSLNAAAQALTAAVDHLRAQQQREMEAAEDFARRLAVAAITELTGAVLARDSHEVRTLVRRILEEALGGQQAGEVQLAGHPDDLARLPKDFCSSCTEATVKLVPDADLPRGSFRVHAEGAEFMSSLTQRLRVMQERLLREPVHAS